MKTGYKTVRTDTDCNEQHDRLQVFPTRDHLSLRVSKGNSKTVSESTNLSRTSRTVVTLCSKINNKNTKVITQLHRPSKDHQHYTHFTPYLILEGGSFEIKELIR